MARKRSTARLTPSLELGQAYTKAIFVATYENAYRIEIAGISSDHVVFRVVYEYAEDTLRRHEFEFRFGEPFIYLEHMRRTIRLDQDAYRLLYRLAEVLMHAVIAGFPNNEYIPTGKGYFRLADPALRFKIQSLNPSRFGFEYNGKRYQIVRDRTQVFPEIPSELVDFLRGFGHLLMEAYEPYVRKQGPQLAPLTLFPEAEPVHRVTQLRHKRKLEELRNMGKAPRKQRKGEQASPTQPRLL